MIIVNNTKEDLTYRAHGTSLELKPGVNITDIMEFTAEEIKNHFGVYVSVIIDRDGSVVKEEPVEEGDTNETTKADDVTGEGKDKEDDAELGKDDNKEEGEGETGEDDADAGKEEDGNKEPEVEEKCKPCYAEGKTPNEDDCKACKEKEAEGKQEKKETKKQDKPKRGSGKKNK